MEYFDPIRTTFRRVRAESGESTPLGTLNMRYSTGADSASRGNTRAVVDLPDLARFFQTLWGCGVR